jgi:hypothetical protein
MEEDWTELRVEGWSQRIREQIEPRWPPVLRDWFPADGEESVEWHSLFLQYVFPLDDPRSFPTLSSADWSADERARLDRYLAHAEDLAGSTVLTARAALHFSLPSFSAGKWEVRETKSARDATVGFLTMFRQCYAPGEQASFKRVCDLISREADKSGLPREAVGSWKAAQNKMRQTHLDHLILERGLADGLMEPYWSKRNVFEPGTVDSPEQLLSAIFYGDAIHWGDTRTVLDDWDDLHPFLGMRHRFGALRVAVQLGHLYVGFAAVVGRATGELSAADL